MDGSWLEPTLSELHSRMMEGQFGRPSGIASAVYVLLTVEISIVSNAVVSYVSWCRWEWSTRCEEKVWGAVAHLQDQSRGADTCMKSTITTWRRSPRSCMSSAMIRVMLTVTSSPSGRRYSFVPLRRWPCVPCYKYKLKTRCANKFFLRENPASTSGRCTPPFIKNCIRSNVYKAV